jgi:hypothetical protein
MPQIRLSNMIRKLLINHFIIEQAEPRLPFSADFEPIPFDGGLPDENVLDGSSVVKTDLVPNVNKSIDTISEEHQRHELIFVDRINSTKPS